jgi:hypothetical protein
VIRLAAVGLLLVIDLLAALLPRTVAASTGVSIDLGRIDVREVLLPGHVYDLPTLAVADPGTNGAGYHMTVQYVASDRQRHPPTGWFAFSVERFTLRPGQTRPVHVTMALPPDAEPGRYQALLAAVLEGAGPGAAVGTAAATRLTFSVAPSASLDAWTSWLGRYVAMLAPWLGLVLALVAVGLVVAIGRRRFSITIQRRR